MECQHIDIFCCFCSNPRSSLSFCEIEVQWNQIPHCLDRISKHIVQKVNFSVNILNSHVWFSRCNNHTLFTFQINNKPLICLNFINISLEHLCDLFLHKLKKSGRSPFNLAVALFFVNWERSCKEKSKVIHNRCRLDHSFQGLCVFAPAYKTKLPYVASVEKRPLLFLIGETHVYDFDLWRFFVSQ